MEVALMHDDNQGNREINFKLGFRSGWLLGNDVVDLEWQKRERLSHLAIFTAVPSALPMPSSRSLAKPPDRILLGFFDSAGIAREGDDPDEVGQQSHFGTVVLKGQPLLEYCIWYHPDEDPEDVKREIETHISRAASMDIWLREHPPVVEWKMNWPAKIRRSTSLPAA
jgi:hypothetical protein